MIEKDIQKKQAKTRLNKIFTYWRETIAKRETARKVGAVQTIKKAGVTWKQVPDHVQDALTKDYSQVMKAIDNTKMECGCLPDCGCKEK
tara:strand:+ start:301 stop:567 length:267 start_codon:yes stop_codon:yes gene_type:complete